MSARERLQYVNENVDTVYPCPGCDVPYLITWHGTQVTVMKKRGY
jgi:hypothetical protein